MLNYILYYVFNVPFSIFSVAEIPQEVLLQRPEIADEPLRFDVAHCHQNEGSFHHRLCEHLVETTAAAF